MHISPVRSRRILFWLVALGIALGSATYAIDPLSFLHPQLALGAIAWMAAVSASVRVVPGLRRRQALSETLEIAALFIYVTLLTASTGATGSPFVSLYALPLIASSLSWKPGSVVLLALAVVGVSVLLSGFLDTMNDLRLLTTVVVLANTLGPSITASLILATFRNRAG